MKKWTVGILTAGRPDLLGPCLESIRSSHLRDATLANLVVVENSLNRNVWRTLEAMTVQRGGQLQINQEEKSLATCWNFIANFEPHNDLVAILNDDVEVVDYWLDALQSAILVNPKMGVVGLEQHRSSKLCGFEPQSYPFSAAPYNVYTVGCGGYCFGIHRDPFVLAGGFDEAYWRYYEELDFHCRLCELGYRNADLMEPRVYHQIGSTLGRQMSSETNLVVSRQRFIEKWAGRTGLPLAVDRYEESLELLTQHLLRAFPDDRPKLFWTQAIYDKGLSPGPDRRFEAAHFAGPPR
jgi:GT2 family glycosyltransferase